MQRLRWLSILMIAAILGITGFQAYWLGENYKREKRTLEMRANGGFRETMLHLQTSKMNFAKLRTNFDTLDRGNVKVVVTDKGTATYTFGEQIMSRINVIRDKMRDSLKPRGGMMIALDTDMRLPPDSLQFTERIPVGVGRPGGPFQRHDVVFDFLTRVDSLQDSLKVREIDSAYKRSLNHQKLNIPFNIIRLDTCCDEPEINEVTVGFKAPVTYRMELGNTVPYLIKKISAPILFSIVLLGITILSFVSLYRTLLRQQRLAALKNEFISNITHELKTPIATVGVAIEALKNFNAMDNPARTREYLDISSNELQRLSLLVDKVLKLSMFEKKEIDLKYETLNLKDIVDEVTASMRLQLEKYHANVTVTQEGNPVLQADRLHMQSVVFNLLDNALKYSKEHPVINIHVAEAGDHVQLSIADNGIGIPQEYKEKIFDKFVRVPHGDTHNAKGYGLGLSYVAHVVEKHKGKIEVESQEGNGTRFMISLPKA